MGEREDVRKVKISRHSKNYPFIASWQILTVVPPKASLQ